MTLKEFVNVVFEVLGHSTLYVIDTLAAATVDCGEAYNITDDGKLLGADDEVIFDFSDWDNEEDAPGVISAIKQDSIEVCYNYRLIKLVIPSNVHYDLVLHFLQSAQLVK